MAIKVSSEGFFTSSGTLRSDLSNRTTSQSASSAEDVTQRVADTTASEIMNKAEAALVRISSRMNVAGTGFDSGVSSLVNQAVSAGLKKQEERVSTESAASISTGSSSKQTGGSYQNEILKADNKMEAKAEEKVDTVA